MDTIIKVFAGLFMTLFLTFTGTGLIASSINAGKAERFAADSSMRIGNSNYSDTVIENCKKDAEKSGYVMDVISELCAYVESPASFLAYTLKFQFLPRFVALLVYVYVYVNTFPTAMVLMKVPSLYTPITYVFVACESPHVLGSCHSILNSI